MKICSKKWLFILACFLFSGCAEKLEIDYKYVPSVSVSGRITNLDKKHVVSVKHASSLQGVVLEPYVNAKLSVQDDRGQEAKLLEIEGGKYELSPDQFSIKIGDIYRLKIQLKDKKIYYSEWQEVFPPVEISALSYHAGPKRYFVASEVANEERLEDSYNVTSQINNSTTSSQYIYFEEFGEFEVFAHPYLFEICPIPPEIPRCYIAPKSCCGACWVTDMKRIKYHGLYLVKEGESIEVIAGVVPMDEYRFNQGNYRSTIVQHTVGEKEFNFLNEVKSQINSGNVFDSQPSQLKGNIYLEGKPEIRLNGYFGVGSAIEKSIFIKRDKIRGLFYNDDCRLLNSSHKFLESTAIKPSYWE